MINNHGGLYNRLTYTIKLSPFTLSECEEFYKAIGVNLSRYDITQSYMILGGVPYYLRAFSKELSLAQNVDNLIFKKNAPFKNEYDRLFSSMSQIRRRKRQLYFYFQDGAVDMSGMK